MTEQEQKEIVLAARSRLTGDLEADMLMLEAEVRKYSASEEGSAVAAELLELAKSLMSDEQKDYLRRTIYIGERRLDRVYADAIRLMKNKEVARALEVTKELYEHILEHFPETDTARFFSFRNFLESNLYHQLYHPTKNLLKAPFDLTLYIGAHAYNLIELKRPEEAVAVLAEAIRYNPVNPDPRFELAEAYKLLCQSDNLLTAIKETLPVCTTRYSLGRCYANLGYYCVEVQDFDSAICFYYESLVFHDHPAVPGELRHIGQLTGRRIVRPTRVQIMEAVEKYEIPHGPCEEMFYILTAMAKQAMDTEKWDEATYYMQLISDLTNDPRAAEDLKRCAAELEKQKAAEA